MPNNTMMLQQGNGNEALGRVAPRVGWWKKNFGWIDEKDRPGRTTAHIIFGSLYLIPLVAAAAIILS